MVNFASVKEGQRIQRVWDACNQCDLGKTRQCCVPFTGTPSRVLFLGEGPGAREDKQGEAFVGKAGTILRAAIRRAGYNDKRDVAYTNLVACRPHDVEEEIRYDADGIEHKHVFQVNRPPTAKEVEACWPRLAAVVRWFAPRAVVLCGRVPQAHRGPLSLLHEWDRDDESFQFVPVFHEIYHPAYIARQGGLRSGLGKEWGREIKRILEKEIG